MVSLTINCQNADIMCSMAPHGRKRKYRFFNDFVKEELVGLIPDVHVKLNVETHESSTGDHPNLMQIFLHYPDITGSADMFNEFKENISTIVERNGKIVETFNMCTYPLMYSVFLTVAGEENVFKYPLPQISGRRVS
ncbi:hypothetical protein QR680_014517 [Steinernema hermaphroditum]|uniref:Uncharacterized protein n=1 Tax=Steinernema hermaphroditum TaxID=289476 RepID=A0AA39IAK0_9BILA|nr:hypothetical protein QR680_014517 [Steinernema hermaphroditum]